MFSVFLRALASLLMAVMLFACDKGTTEPLLPPEEEEVPTPIPPTDEPNDSEDDGESSEDSNGQEPPEEDTRTISVTAVSPLSWKEGDRILLFCPQAAGKTRETVTLTNVGSDADSYQFTTSSMEWSETGEHDFYATCPSTPFEQDRSVSFSLPAIQNASASGEPEKSYFTLVATQIGVSCTEESMTLPFVSAYSNVDIVFTASEDVNISRIVVSSVDGTPVVGEYKARFTGSNCNFEPISGISSRMAIQIDADSGVLLSSGTQACFRAFLLPNEYAGLKVDLLTPDGKVFSATTECAVPASTSIVVDFGTLEALSSCSTVYSDWMQYIPDNALVSDLSIPGTHDAATYGITGGMSSWYTCQSKDFNAQLAGGVRVFDLRPDGSDMMIYHATGSTGITLSQALGYMKSYIQDNPTEGCIAFIKEENDWVAENVSPTLAVYADDIVQYTEKLTMGQLRGKILVLSRTNYPGTIYGGNFSKGWPDNTSGGSVGVGYNQSSWTETFWLQDQYNSGTGTNTKIASFKAYADKARTEKPEDDWLCNHVSLAGNPKNNAKILNPQAASYINENPGRLGVIMMDFACDASVGGGDELVNAVINQNVRYVQGVKMK